MNNIRTKTV